MYIHKKGDADGDCVVKRCMFVHSFSLQQRVIGSSDVVHL